MISSRMPPIFLLGSVVLLAWPRPGTSAENQGGSHTEIRALIDQLTEISQEPGILNRYGPGKPFKSVDFSPVEGGREYFVDLGRHFPSAVPPSEIMRKLVSRGPQAVPHLLAHLDDQRRTRIRTPSPTWGFGGEGLTDSPSAGWPRGVSITMRVGDLCYVALGQIVNRDYFLVYPYLEGNITIVSPARSPTLREKVRKAWQSLTPQKHRGSLIADASATESTSLVAGAFKRLGYYYPDALEPIALDYLARPTYSGDKVWQFIRKVLYPEKDPKRRRSLLDAFLAKEGPAARDGVLLGLFDNLETLEYYEAEKVPPTNYSREFDLSQARPALIDLFGLPPKVTGKDRPRLKSLDTFHLGRLIKGGLYYDTSEKIDRAVRYHLVSAKDDPYLAEACIKRLIGRGYERDIEAYCGQKPIKGYENYFPYLVEETLDKLGWTRLHVAVHRDQVDRVAQLLREGRIKVNERGRNGKTALHLAAEGGHLEIANMLLDAGASLTLKDGKGKISVQRALEEGHLELIRLLIRRGSPIPDPFVATVVGRLDLLNGFLKSDRKGADQKTPYGQTLLHLAAWSGQTRAVSALLAQGAKVDEYTCDFPTELWPNNIFGVTALDIASALGHEEIVRELIRFGSSIRETNGSEDPFQYITTLAPLHRVARYGHTRVAKLYLDAKVPLSVKVAETGQTPLHLAACWGHGDMTELFLKHGADVHAADEMGRTPLHAAVESGDERVVHLLLKHGAKVTTRDELKLTPLDLARRIKEVSLAKILEKP